MQVLIFYLYQLMSAKAPQHPMVARANRLSVQSQNVEGWAIETFEPCSRTMFKNDVHRIFCGAAWHPYRGNYRPPTVGITDPPTVGITEK